MPVLLDLCAASTDCQLVIIDVHLKGFSQFSMLKELTASGQARVLLLTDRVDEVWMRRAMYHGASGIIEKTASLDELAQAVRQVASGGCWPHGESRRRVVRNQQDAHPEYRLYRLSRQESRVLQLVMGGLRNKQIAAHLGLTEHTVKTHMSNILRKLEIDNRTRLVVALQRTKYKGMSA